jgi:hypothetical protein
MDLVSQGQAMGRSVAMAFPWSKLGQIARFWGMGIINQAIFIGILDKNAMVLGFSSWDG